MKHAKNTDLTDRRKASIEAKQALLESYRSAVKAAEPGLAARQAERQAIATAREERRAANEKAKTEERQRLLAEQEALIAAAAAEAQAEAEARATAERDRINRVVQDEAARKAERDRRYAERKARRN